jgi:hypothetical protein
MPSVDETLRRAFDAADDDWDRRAEPARAVVLAQHRRQQVVRRGVTATALVGAAAAAVLVLGNDPAPRSRGVEPAAPAPSTSASGVTALEGTWTSARLDVADVRDAARAAGAPEAADLMLDLLPGVPFRVVSVVRGAELTTTITAPGSDGEVMDQESLSVTGDRVDLRPFGGVDARTVHTWVLAGDRLSFDLVTTTEPVSDGVPGEAWQRLFYDTASFTR